MPVKYLLDEHLRGALWTAVLHHNAAGVDPIDVVRVGDPPDLPLGTKDPDLLLWAEREGRVVVTKDCGTMPTHLGHHLRSGHHSAGVFIVRGHFTLPQIVFHLVLFSHAGDPATIEDQFDFIP